MRCSILYLLLLFSINNFAQISLSIPQIQGSGISSAYITQQVKTTGIVTAKFIGTGKINAYFLQDADGDGNNATSDAIFVYNTTDNVLVGDKIQLVATVSEYNGRTQLSNITNKTLISSNNVLPITKVLYNADYFDWERYEGMLLEFDQILYVSSTTNLQQYGQLSLSPKRIYSPTNQFIPGSAAYFALIAENAKTQLTIDDGITTTNYTPIAFADINGARRTGERIKNLKAIVDFSSKYILYPVDSPVFYGNYRPTIPNDLGNCNLKICSFNLEYYLTTNYGQGYGPDDATEAAKQHTKIITALLAIDADIFGLIEIEQGQAALLKITAALNTATISGRYAYINDGGAINGTYTKVGFIYRTDKVSPYLSLQNNNSPSPINRKKIQAFTLKANNEKFIFSLNHFKAKSGCSSASGLDADQSDGQSCYNATRVAEANSTLNLLTSSKTYYAENDVLIMGDLNAYGKENPIQTFINGGYFDLHQAFHADSAYSYLYNGEAGYLDHALVSASLKSQVTGVSVFHINADELAMFEYSGSAYKPDMYRCSDHDPVIVGLSLGTYLGESTHLNQEISIFPTVVDNNFTINNAFGNKLELYSINGKLIKQYLIQSNEYQIDISNLKLMFSVYILKLTKNQYSFYYKIIKTAN